MWPLVAISISAKVCYIIASEYLRLNEEWRIVLFGIVLTLTILFIPEGIGGKLKKLSQKYLVK